MPDTPVPAAIIRPAVPADADAIARIYLESAEYHAGLDSQRYFVPAFEIISTRYRDGDQHPSDAAGSAITFIAELRGTIAGFLDARLERSSDAMHREILYCQIVEVAVANNHRRQGIGEQLLRAAEDWGRERGATFAILEYLAANQSASTFYRDRMGYRPAASTVVKPL